MLIPTIDGSMLLIFVGKKTVMVAPLKIAVVTPKSDQSTINASLKGKAEVFVINTFPFVTDRSDEAGICVIECLESS